ncbi:MAG: AzlD domain-containing protein [Solirubrobacterales bacterium]
MAEQWVLVISLIATTAAIRASGPIVLGGRELPERAMNVVTLLAPALLAALVTTETFRGENDSSLTLDERALGLAAAGAALALRGGIIVAGAAALLVTAAARAVL